MTMDIWKINRKLVKEVRSALSVTFKVLSKLALIIVMLLYVMLGAAAVTVIVEKEYIRYQPKEEINAILDRMVITNRVNELEKWLRHRKIDDIEYMVRAIEPKSSYINPVIFFTIAGKFFQIGLEDEGLFWFNLAQYRLRYDILRCSAGDESVGVLENIINIAHDSGVKALGKDDPGRIKKSLKRVIEFDKRHPPKNDMEEVCFMVAQLEGKDELNVAPIEEWPEIRSKLIQSAKDFVEGKNSKK